MTEHDGSFVGSVDELLGPHLERRGFALRESSPTTVIYRRQRALLSFSHLMEDWPPAPVVQIDVGLVAPDGSVQLAGLWRAFDTNDPIRAYTTWRIEDCASLHRVLGRIATEVLPACAAVWQSEEAIGTLLVAQAEEVERTHQAERRRADLVQARQALEAGRLQQAIDAYVLLDPETLPAADRRRLLQARRQLEARG